jgi:hypothetical protein
MIAISKVKLPNVQLKKEINNNKRKELKVLKKRKISKGIIRL